MQDRVPPQNIEAEQAVLGSMLIDKEAVAQVTEQLVADDFYREAHKTVFDVIVKLFNKNEPIDMITVSAELTNRGKLEDIGGISYITLLANVVPTAANVKYHAKIVEEKSLLRQLVTGGTKIAAMGYEGGDNVRQLIDDAEKTVLKIATRKGDGDFVEISPVVVETLKSIEELMDTKGKITGLKSGFVDFDNMTAGLHPSDFIILAARPSMGKTALALNIAANVAIRDEEDGKKKSVAFFSLEMSRQQLVQRMLCSEAAVDAQKLRVGMVGDAEWGNLWTAADRLGQARIFIDDTPGITIMEMRSRARKLKA